MARVGILVEIDRRFDFGAGHGLVLTDPADDVMDRRVTVALAVR